MKTILYFFLLCPTLVYAAGTGSFEASNNVTGQGDTRYVNSPTEATAQTMTGNFTVTGATITTNGPISANYLDLLGFNTDNPIYSFISEMDRPLASGIEVSNILGRIRWKDSGNSNAILNGIEGVCSSTTTDESITCRGGSFRTYTATGGTIRTSVGADISARAGIPSATDIVAESGTGFIGARIYMAPGFSPGTIANVNNFHGLWIYNEHPTNAVTNGIFLSDAGGGFTKDVTLQHGESIDNATDDVVNVTAATTMLSGQLVALGTATVYGAGGMTVDGGYFSVGKSTTLIVTNGKVGIGATPTVPFMVTSAGTGGVNYRFKNTGAAAYASLSLENSNGDALSFIRTNRSDYTGPYLTGGSAGNAAIIATDSSVPIDFGTNSLPRMTIASGGNVGIGTTAPATLLHVRASGANGIVISTRSDTGDSSGNLFIGDDTNGIGMKTSFGRFGIYTGAVAGQGSGTERVSLTQTGNVGIGTTSPVEELDINGDVALTDSTPLLYSGGTNDGADSRIFKIGVSSEVDTNRGPNVWLYGNENASAGYKGKLSLSAGIAGTATAGDSEIQLKTNDTTRIDIAYNGNVGIGTTNPAYAILDVVGATGQGQIWVSTGTPNTTGNYGAGMGITASNGGIITGDILGDLSIYTSRVGGGSGSINFSANGGTTVNLKIRADGLTYVYSRTLAQIDLITPLAIGGQVMCSNCSLSNTICVSSGTAQGAFTMLNSVTHCN